MDVENRRREQRKGKSWQSSIESWERDHSGRTLYCNGIYMHGYTHGGRISEAAALCTT